LSRSLLPAFLMALTMHSLLAWVDLDFFNRPFPVVPQANHKTLTIDIFVPRPVKNPSLIKSPSMVVKEPERKPIVKKVIKREVKQKPSIKPARLPQQARPPAEQGEASRGISRQAEQSIIKGKPPEKDETIAHLSRGDLSAIKKEGFFLKEDDSFLPDMVDIPAALPTTEHIPDSPPDLPITYALPIYKKNIPPKYPTLARKRGYQGKVLLEVLVKKNGRAGPIRLARSSGYEILDRAAIRVVRDWVFRPAKRGDEVIEMWVEIPIRFQLK
jgi:protein TonB